MGSMNQQYVTMEGNIFTRRLPVQVKRMRTLLKHKLQRDSLCPHTNIYHCSTVKTASQWIKRIFLNVYPHSGLDVFSLVVHPEKMQDLQIERPFPRWSCVSQLYIDYETYRLMPKSGSYRTFFILRDPRDIAVSMYFSLRYSHGLVGKIAYHREILSKMSLIDGLIHAMRHTIEHGILKAQLSWIEQCNDENVKIFRYENLARDEEKLLRELFCHCDILISEKELKRLVENHSFEALTGRKRNEEDKSSHYRKGIEGDWKNYFDKRCTEEFKRISGNIVVKLGYEKDDRW